MRSLDHPAVWFRAAISLALAMAVGWTGAGLAGWSEHEAVGLSAGSFIVLVMIALTLLACLRTWATTDPEGRRKRFDEALLVPSALVPLAVVPPWLVLITNDYGVFYDTVPALLDRVLISDLVGLFFVGALLVTCCTPAVLALRASWHSQPAVWVGMLCALHLVAYLPVAIYVDALALRAASEVLIAGPRGARAGDPFEVAHVALAMDLGAGALLRLAATASVVTFAVRMYRRRRESQPVWEMS